MVGVVFICCTFVAKIKCHLSYTIAEQTLYFPKFAEQSFHKKP